MKGALVELTAPMGAGVPGVVVFQFNPETMRHAWSPPDGASAAGRTDSNPLAVRGMPSETFSFTLAMDITDQLASLDPTVSGPAKTHGITPRLAALEMLLFPTSAGGPAPPPGNVPSQGERRAVPASQVPTVLFVWGPDRILPVRVTSLTITERLYDPDRLVATHAEAQVELRVLSPADLQAVSGPVAAFAASAYSYSHRRRAQLAAASITDAGRAVLGFLGDVPLQL